MVEDRARARRQASQGRRVGAARARRSSPTPTTCASRRRSRSSMRCSPRARRCAPTTRSRMPIAAAQTRGRRALLRRRVRRRVRAPTRWSSPTEWNQFRALDVERLKQRHEAPVVVDLRNVYDPGDAARDGIRYSRASGGHDGGVRASPAAGASSARTSSRRSCVSGDDGTRPSTTSRRGRRENLEPAPDWANAGAGAVPSWSRATSAISTCRRAGGRGARLRSPSGRHRLRSSARWRTRSGSNDVNVTGHAATLLVRRARCRMSSASSYASSSSVYGESDDAAQESRPCPAPISPYGIAKLAGGDATCAIFHRLYGRLGDRAALLQRVRAAPGSRQRVRRRRPEIHRA